MPANIIEMKMKNISAIYFDDTGNPGTDPLSPFLSETRKSWAGVIVPRTISESLYAAMDIFARGIRDDFGAEELHFTDIYSGRGVWKSVELHRRIEIFDLMSLVCSKFDLPIIYQTWSEEFANDHKSLKYPYNYKKNFWDTSNIGHFGLILAIMQARDVIENLRSQSGDFADEFQIYVDEGLAKAGVNIALPIKKQGVFSNNIRFLSSQESAGLQIADFAAFTIARSQRIMMSKTAGQDFSRADRHILSIVEKLNHWTLDLMAVDPISASKEGYEFLLMRDRMNKGLKKKPG